MLTWEFPPRIIGGIENVAVWVELTEGSVFWDTPRQREFGHGYLLRVRSREQHFMVSLGVDRAS